MKSDEIEISNAALRCREDGTKMQYITNKHDMNFWWCPVCDAMILESETSSSLCYLTPGEWK